MLGRHETDHRRVYVLHLCISSDGSAATSAITSMTGHRWNVATLCSVQESAEHPSLPVQVLSRDPQNLSLANHLRRFDSLNHRPCRRHRPRSLHGSESPFDVPMVGFDSVIAVASSGPPAIAVQLPFRLQLSKGSRIAAQTVSGEHVRRPIVRN